jgi:hypothetical protein
MRGMLAFLLQTGADQVNSLKKHHKYKQKHQHGGIMNNTKAIRFGVTAMLCAITSLNSGAVNAAQDPGQISRVAGRLS